MVPLCILSIIFIINGWGGANITTKFGCDKYFNTMHLMELVLLILNPWNVEFGFSRPWDKIGIMCNKVIFKVDHQTLGQVHLQLVN